MRNSHILTPGCSRLHSIFEMRKVDAISIHVGFFLPEACTHWYFLQVRSNATNRNASYDEPMCRKKPTNINIAIVFRISIILWSRLHLWGQNVRDSHILVGFSPPTYPQGEVEKPTKMCLYSHSFVGFFPTKMCERFQLELRYLLTNVHKEAILSSWYFISNLCFWSEILKA